MPIEVQLESLTTNSRFATPVYADRDGNGLAVGSERPLPTADIVALRAFEGRSYSLGYVNDFANPLQPASSIDIAIAWAQGVSPRLTVYGLCAGNAIGYLYEGAVVSGGTAMTSFNINRNYSTTASQSAALLNPTVSNVGNLLIKQILIGGEGKKAGGGDVGSPRLFLKPLTTYLFRLTNVNGTSHAAEMILEWYE